MVLWNHYTMCITIYMDNIQSKYWYSVWFLIHEAAPLHWHHSILISAWKWKGINNNSLVLCTPYTCENITAALRKVQQHIDGLVQERCNSSALAMELCLSCINPPIRCVADGCYPLFSGYVSNSVNGIRCILYKIIPAYFGSNYAIKLCW